LYCTTTDIQKIKRLEEQCIFSNAAEQSPGLRQLPSRAANNKDNVFQILLKRLNQQALIGPFSCAATMSKRVFLYQKKAHCSTGAMIVTGRQSTDFKGADKKRSNIK